MSPEEVRALAQEHYGDEFKDSGPDAPMFALLVDVADAYVKELEKIASEDPAPFFLGSTPMQSAIFGLAENLEMIREPHLSSEVPPEQDDRGERGS